MDHADNEYFQEEAAAEGGVPIAAIEIEIPQDIPDSPESPSPVPLSPTASPGPAFPVDPLGYNSEEEAFGGAEFQIFFSGGVAPLQEWAEFVRGVRGGWVLRGSFPLSRNNSRPSFKQCMGTSGRSGCCPWLEKLFLKSCGLRWWAIIARLHSNELSSCAS